MTHEVSLPIERTAPWWNRQTPWLILYCVGYILVTLAMQEPTLRTILASMPQEMVPPGGRLKYGDGMVWFSIAGAVISAIARLFCVTGVCWAALLMLAPSRFPADGFRRILWSVTVASFLLLLRDGLNAVLLHARGLDDITDFRQLFALFAFDTLVSGDLSFPAFRVAVALDPFFLLYLGALAMLLRHRVADSWSTAVTATGITAVTSLGMLYVLATLQKPPGA